MTIGVLNVTLFISNSNSLKSKRTVMRALVTKIRNSFNVSVSEVDYHDKWQKALLGIAIVGAETTFINSVLDKILDFIRSDGNVQILDFEMEMI